MPATCSQLRSIKNLSDLVVYLRDELGWPIETDDIEELTFDYQPEELGLEPQHAVKIKNPIRQIRPLETGQPWGIFYVEFEKKKLPVVVLRRILSHLVMKKRASANKSDAQRWRLNDLLFISAFGQESSDQREIAFAHFHQTAGDLPTLRVLGWDGADTVLKLEHLSETLAEKLRWPENPADLDAWRERWSGAFRHRLGHVVRTADHLAQVLADVAKRIRAAAQKLLEAESERGPLTKLFKAFQAALIHDLTEETFADTYAQTITYGLLTAAINRTDMSGGAEATYVKADDVTLMVRVTSPFLKEMLETFLTVGGRKNGVDFDELGIQDVVELLRGNETDLPAILRDFGNRTRGEDPVIHFYEHFLSAYNKKLKIQRGVFYTPQPVVSYIVRSVHELLQIEFGLEDGLASTVTWREMLQRHKDLELPTVNEPGEPAKTISPDEPFVQILDIATGTATFLVEVIEVIFQHLKAKWAKGGVAAMPALKNSKVNIVTFADYWNSYVPEHLLPRLHGYELLAAPYAIAHLKLGLKLTETGYRFGSDERARIYLTNTLEPKVRQLPQIGFDALAHEAAAVNEIKWCKRFTVVLGNPPYSNFGQLNRNSFILDLLEDYKRGLDEKKLNLDDDFIKFLRFGQHQLQHTGVGCIGMITNNVYLDGVTHRQMRQSLTETFDSVGVLDLHGNSKRQEKTPSGGKDDNVFDILIGVAIVTFLKRPSRSSARILHADLWGKRESKYGQLLANTASNLRWQNAEAKAPYYFFVPKDFSVEKEYDTAFRIEDAFVVRQNGLKTDRDELFYDYDKVKLSERAKIFFSKTYDREFKERFRVVASSSFDIEERRDQTRFDEARIRTCLYRPLDLRWLYYDPKLTSRPAEKVMRHMSGQNMALVTGRQGQVMGDIKWDLMACSPGYVDTNLFYRGGNIVFPLYLMDEEVGLGFGSHQEGQSAQDPRRRTNYSRVFLNALASKLTVAQFSESSLPAGLTPEDIFQYAYAVFHSPGYRSRYAEFLKIDFPRLPLTGNLELFRALARLGGELTALHLLESSKLDEPITTFIGGRNAEVEKVSSSANTVWLDKAQTTGFKGVREDVWNFHIGGYQVCEKWLKDRKGRTLTKDDIVHYHKIVVALAETIRLMAEIDVVIEKAGGWPLK